MFGAYLRFYGVALRKESVDRKSCFASIWMERMLSLSARRAWIENSRWEVRSARGAVALRKESVDRKFICSAGSYAEGDVALRKESVDRKKKCRKSI